MSSFVFGAVATVDDNTIVVIHKLIHWDVFVFLFVLIGFGVGFFFQRNAFRGCLNFPSTFD